MNNNSKIIAWACILLASSYTQAMQQQEDNNNNNLKALYTDLLQARERMRLGSNDADNMVLEAKTVAIGKFLELEDINGKEHKTLQAIKEYFTTWLDHCSYTFGNKKQKSSEHDPQSCPHCQSKNMVQHITGKSPSPLFLQCCPSSDAQGTDNGNDSGDDEKPIIGKGPSSLFLESCFSPDKTDNDNNSNHKREAKKATNNYWHEDSDDDSDDDFENYPISLLLISNELCFLPYSNDL